MTYTKEYLDCWFVVDYTDNGHGRLMVCAKQIIALDMEDAIDEVAEEPYLEAWVKFDGEGCFVFQDQLYMDGLQGLTQHTTLLQHIYAEAREKLGPMCQ